MYQEIPKTDMPRTSAVDQLGVGDRVMQLAIVEQKSIPQVIDTISAETGVVLSTDMIRNWLKVQPAEIIEKAERVGLAKDLKPILDYSAHASRIYTRIEQIMDKLEEGITISGMETESVFIADISKEFEIDPKVVKKIIARVEKEHMGPKLMGLLARYLGEARKTMETAHKIDPALRSPGRSGPATGRPTYNIQNANILTGDDLISALNEAKGKHGKVVETEG